jgi:hypothetical protein
MADKKIDTSIIDLIKTSVKSVESGDRAPFDKLIKSIEKTIPVKGKKRMPKVDPNINNKFRIKRIGYDVIAKITTDRDDLYKATVVSIADGISPFAIDESFPISKRELELCGRKILDI